MPRNFHVLPREPSRVPMPPVKPTKGPRSSSHPVDRSEQVWPYFVIGAAVVAVIAIGIFA